MQDKLRKALQDKDKQRARERCLSILESAAPNGAGFWGQVCCVGLAPDGKLKRTTDALNEWAKLIGVEI